MVHISRTSLLHLGSPYSPSFPLLLLFPSSATCFSSYVHPSIASALQWVTKLTLSFIHGFIQQTSFVSPLWSNGNSVIREQQ